MALEKLSCHWILVFAVSLITKKLCPPTYSSARKVNFCDLVYMSMPEKKREQMKNLFSKF